MWLALLVALVSAWPGTVGADEATAPPPRSRPRSVGIGVGTTGGWFEGRTPTLKWQAPTFGLLDVNLVAHIDPLLDLQLWLPLSWMIFQSAVDGTGFFQGAVIARLHPARTGFFLGPGIDLHAFRGASRSDRDFAVTFPLAIGWESGYPDRSFGFTIALRPEVGVLLDRDAGNRGLGWGLLLELDLVGYFLSSEGPSSP